MTKYLKWFTESQRPIHFAVGLLAGIIVTFVSGSFLGGVIAGFLMGAAAEYKDWAHAGKIGGKLGFLKGKAFDYLDLLATVLGSVVGALFSLIV